MLSSAFAGGVALGAAFEEEAGFERDGKVIVDGDVARHRGDIAVTIGLAHGFVEQGGDDAAVRVAGRALELRGEIHAADDAVLFVDEELQVESYGVGFAASEAAIQGAVRERNPAWVRWIGHTL